MNHDRQITISAAGTRKAVKWPRQTLLWSEFVDRLRTPAHGPETLEAYLALPKQRQDELKDVGGFVAGALKDDRRKAGHVLSRDVLTLDLDNIPAGGTDDILRRLGGLPCGAAVYSTRKHHDAAPRLRVLVPLSRPVTADEYEPIARKLAEIIGLEFCDPTTFEASRLMYWGSCCSDSQYVYQAWDKPFIDADGMLALYKDWHDISSWPQVPGAQQAQIKLADRQKDPTAKSGIVGAFCKTYDIYKALDAFLPEVYLSTDTPDRYTYSGGSTTGGAVVYDNGLFLYSHHATDPCGGRLVNAWDLVRLHMFGDMDDDALPGTPTNRLPSYVAMCELAAADSEASALLNAERYDQALTAFSGPLEGTQIDTEWMKQLTVSPVTALPVKTIDNMLLILLHDPALIGKLAVDEFSNRGIVTGSLPWDPREDKRIWTDNDDAGAQWYFEKRFGLTGKEKVMNALSLAGHKNHFNDLKDYLEGLEWDGIQRVDTLLIDYLGAEDSVYTRAVIRKSLAAAVARVMTPGVKYDLMPILSGPQGIGKSTFLRILGGRWFSDSLQTFEGKEASEMIQGTWINEIGELNGMTRSEITAVKQFLSRSEDIFRVPYGRRTETYPRRCIFFGTTNDAEFLRDNTGNRRFLPVDVGVQPITKNIFTQLSDEVDQIWAEAFVRWQLGEALYLTGEAEKISREQQEIHRESNAKEGQILEFLARPIPPNWYDMSLDQRRIYNNVQKNESPDSTPRMKTCALEIWCECFGEQRSRLRQTDTREINGILARLPGWKKSPGNLKFGGEYGPQRGYFRETD